MNHGHRLVLLSISSAVMLSFSAFSNTAPAATQEAAVKQNPSAIADQVRAAVHADALGRAGRLMLDGTVEAKGCNATAHIAIDPAAHSAAIYAEDGGPAGGAEGVDGATAWVRDATGITHRATLPSYAQGLVSDAYWLSGGLANTRWPAQVRYETNAKIGADSADVLEVTPSGGKSTLVWVSQKSHLPMQWSRRDETGVTVTSYADYRNVDGAMIPFEQTTTDADGDTHKYVLHNAVAHADPAKVAALIKMPARLPADFDIQGARSTTVPLRLAGQPYVDVYIDGRGPFNFLVDTSGRLSLSAQTAQKIGFPLFGRGSVTGTSGDTATAQYALIADLRIGDAHVRQQNVQVLDLDRVASGASRRHVDGVIGAEIMERFVSTFDFPNQKLTLSLDSSTGAALASTLPSAIKHAKNAKSGCIDGVATPVLGKEGKLDTLQASLKKTHPLPLIRMSAIVVTGHAHATQLASIKPVDSLPLIRTTVFVIAGHAQSAQMASAKSINQLASIRLARLTVTGHAQAVRLHASGAPKSALG